MGRKERCLSVAFLLLLMIREHARAQCTFPSFESKNVVPSGSLPSTGNFSDGFTLTFECMIGYKPISSSASKSVTCDKNQWTDLKLECTRKSCGSLPDFDHGRYEMEGILFGDKVTAVCYKGFILAGRMKDRWCRSDGWDGRNPVCESVKCEAPPPLENGQLEEEPHSSYDYLAAVSYRCNSGFDLIGSSTLHCSEDGTFKTSSEPPKCFYGCPKPEIPHAIRIEGKSPPYKLNNFIIYRCEDGYTMKGESRIVCKGKGWSPELPVCVEPCIKPNFGGNVTLTEEFRSRQSFPHGSTVIFECIRGHEPVDSTVSRSSTCEETKWTKLLLTCKLSGWSPGAVAGIVAVVLTLFAAAGFLFYRWKKVEEKEVTSTEGDTVTLHTSLTELQTGDEIQWWYGGSLIAKITGGKEQTHDVADEGFSGKLTLDKKTGDLNISDLNIIHSGQYKLEITRKRWIRPTHKRFNLTVLPNEVKIVQASIGQSVTLKNDTKIQTGDQLTWRFEDENSPISIEGGTEPFTVKDKLQLDETGSLTITNITKKDAGFYKLKIISSSKKTTNKTFCVYTEAKEVSVKEGETARLETDVKNLQSMAIRWMCENVILIVKLAGTKVITYDHVLDERFKDRLELDKTTGDLSIKNTNTGDSGQYSFWFERNSKDTFLMFIVSVSGSAGEVTGNKLKALKEDSTENGASESVSVVMPLLSGEQESSL